MATHSSVLAWRIPGTEEPSGLPSMGSHRVGHNWSDLAAAAAIAYHRASLVAQRLKCLPAMWETWVQSLGQEDPLEKEMATHSSILSWRIPWMEELDGLQSIALQRAGHNWSNLACTHAQQILLSTQYVYHLKRFIKSSPWLREVYDLIRERILSSSMVSRRDVSPNHPWVLVSSLIPPFGGVSYHM